MHSFVDVNCRGMFVELDKIKSELQGYPREFLDALTSAIQGQVPEYPIGFGGTLRGDVRPWIGSEGNHVGFWLYLPGASHRSERTGLKIRTSEAIKLVRVFNDYWLA